MVLSASKSLTLTTTNKESKMDKKIKKLQKQTKKLVKGEAELLKADKKRDKACDYGEKMLKKKK